MTLCHAQFFCIALCTGHNLYLFTLLMVSSAMLCAARGLALLLIVLVAVPIHPLMVW